MIKKLQLFCLIAFGSLLMNSQTAAPLISCGTHAPPQQWEDWMSKEVEKFKMNQGTNRTEIVNYTIPVIVHIVSFGEAVGTFPNIDSSQVRTQIIALNNDYAGTGLNSNNVPAQFAGSFAGNTGIKFCRAEKNPNGAAIPEFGVDRVNAMQNSWTNPNASTNIQNYIETVVKPATIWDPTRYLNIWVSDRPTTSTLNGYSSYPAGTSLSGLYGGGMNLGTATTDGVWVYAKAFGVAGSAQPPFDQGRVATHEIGHWLGLRHIWGDGNCLSDYVDDTPFAKQANTGCPPYPSFIDRCGTGTSPYGEMTMNFMDMTDDNCMSLFTHDQNIRMQIAMSQCANRNVLGTHGLCQAFSAPSSSAVPSFSLTDIPCVGRAFSPFNTSNGYPSPSFIWSSTPPAGFSPNPTVANPAITFNTAGTYTLSLVATNTVSNGTYTMAVTVGTCPTVYACIDTLRMIKNTDTLITYAAANSTIVAGCLNGFAGYMTGNNCYNDKEYAQFYSPSTYSGTPYPEVNSVIVLFDSIGTGQGPNHASKVTCKIYGGSINYGPVSALASKQDSMAYIIATTKTTSVRYIGNPNLVTPLARIIPYKFNFSPPVVINNQNTGFFTAVEVPQLYPGDSIRIFSNTKLNTSVNDSSSWALTYNNVWRPLRSYRNAKIQLAIIPQITCSPIDGIKEEKTVFNSNINVVPNPNNGNFSMIFTLPKEEELYIRIYNSVGVEISSSHMQHVSNDAFNVDLSNKQAGIYFTDISNGKEHVVKKIIVAH